MLAIFFIVSADGAERPRSHLDTADFPELVNPTESANSSMVSPLEILMLLILSPRERWLFGSNSFVISDHLLKS